MSKPMQGKYEGVWEYHGLGMVAFFATELTKLYTPNQLPYADKTDWGYEDWALVWVRDPFGTNSSCC